MTFAAKTPAVIRRIRDENGHVSRALITGSTDGLGLAAARTLVDEGTRSSFTPGTEHAHPTCRSNSRQS